MYFHGTIAMPWGWLAKDFMFAPSEVNNIAISNNLLMCLDCFGPVQCSIDQTWRNTQRVSSPHYLTCEHSLKFERPFDIRIMQGYFLTFWTVNTTPWGCKYKANLWKWGYLLELVSRLCKKSRNKQNNSYMQVCLLPRGLKWRRTTIWCLNLITAVSKTKTITLNCLHFLFPNKQILLSHILFLSREHGQWTWNDIEHKFFLIVIFSQSLCMKPFIKTQCQLIIIIVSTKQYRILGVIYIENWNKALKRQPFSVRANWVFVLHYIYGC